MQLKYPFFRENPHLNLLVVDTLNYGPEYRINCRKIDGVYYVKNKDLIHDGVKWVLPPFVMPVKEPPKPVFDYETKQTVPNQKGLTRGIVEIDKEGKETIGWFTPNPYTNCCVSNFNGCNEILCINYDLLKPPFYAERLNTSQFIRTEGLPNNAVNSLKSKQLAINNNHSPYNLMDANGSDMDRLFALYNEHTIPLDKDVKYAANHIKELTFGAEFETINGTLPIWLRNQYGITICKDGSIKDGNGLYPPEYVTLPLSGAKGIQTLRNVTKEISKRSDFNLKCSYHVHIGGFKIDRLFMVSLFKLCHKIQDDVFKMFPFYKTNEMKYAGKEKNYCKKFPALINNYTQGNFNEYINKSYEDIYSFLTGGQRFDSDHNVRARRNPWGGQKWDIKTRYYWVNFVNPIFGKQDTIEFRLHTPTLNSDKVINWLFMCSAIILFAQNNSERCINNEAITFEEVLNIYKRLRSTQYACKLSGSLVEYYNQRVQYFTDNYKADDYLCPQYFKDDKNYKFNAISLV